jgi:hypothetical protein
VAQHVHKIRRRPLRREPDAPQPLLPYRNLDAIVQKASAQFFQRAFDDVVPGVTRLTPHQRAWAREHFGVALPRMIRSDEPSSRRISIETWRIAIAARYQPQAKP